MFQDHHFGDAKSKNQETMVAMSEALLHLLDIRHNSNSPELFTTLVIEKSCGNDQQRAYQPLVLIKYVEQRRQVTKSLRVKTVRINGKETGEIH